MNAYDARSPEGEREAVVHRPPLPAPEVLSGLTDDDRDLLERLLRTGGGFVDAPELHQPDAERNLFGLTAELSSAKATSFAGSLPRVAQPATAGLRVPALSSAQERLLFLRLNYARRMISEAVAAHAGQPLPGKAARMLLAWGRWELDLRGQIVQVNMPLVLAMAKRTRLSGVDFNEMISEGNMALLRSVDKFDCGLGYKFSTYACRAILKSFSRVALRAGRYRTTFPVEFDPAIERSDFVERKREDAVANCVDDLKTILLQNMAALTDVEETVIRQRFALGPASAGQAPMPKTLEQVGEIIGVTKERVRQIQNKALKKIRHALEEHYLAA